MINIDFPSLIYGLTAGVVLAVIVLVGAILIEEYKRERRKQ